MKEDFLHYIWKFKKLDFAHLQTEEGEELSVKKVGTHNEDAGPDFLNARVKIGNTVWAGHVEIHIKSSDWKKHRHHEDEAYNNVILHAVYIHDEPTYNQAGRLVPTLELRSHVKRATIRKYENFMNSDEWIPCEHMINEVPGFTFDNWLQRMLVERLESKTEQIDDLLRQQKGNWEEVFYITLARYFGMKTNAMPFELLAKSLPLKVLAKHKTSLEELEALFFGQAGMLREIFIDDYPVALQKEYDYLRKKYELKAINGETWKFLRLRPANFPTIRISQFAGLIHRSSHLLSKLLETGKPTELRKLFSSKASPYWESHYKFDKESKKRQKQLGKSGIDNLLINVVAPFLFHYGKKNGKDELMDRSFELLENLPAENNKIVKGWDNVLNRKIGNSFESQALIGLKKNYCDQRLCLSCAVGNHLIS